VKDAAASHAKLRPALLLKHDPGRLPHLPRSGPIGCGGWISNPPARCDHRQRRGRTSRGPSSNNGMNTGRASRPAPRIRVTLERKYVNRNKRPHPTFAYASRDRRSRRCAPSLLFVPCALWQRSIPAIGSCPTRICLKRLTRRRSPACRSIGMRTAWRRSYRSSRFTRRGSDLGKLVRRCPPCVRTPIGCAGGTQ